MVIKVVRHGRNRISHPTTPSLHRSAWTASLTRALLFLLVLATGKTLIPLLVSRAPPMRSSRKSLCPVMNTVHREMSRRATMPRYAPYFTVSIRATTSIPQTHTRLCYLTMLGEGYADAGLYAQLSLRLAEQLSEDVQDGQAKCGDGTYLVGGKLFKSYLLDTCHAIFAMRLDSYGILEPSNERRGSDSEDTQQSRLDGVGAVLRSTATSRPKIPQGPGFMRLLGELFLVGLLPLRVVHECVRALLHDVKGVEDACILLSLVGKTLDGRDTPGPDAGAERQREHVDAYFARMQALVGVQASQKGMWRVRAKVQELTDLWERGWTAKSDVASAHDSNCEHPEVEGRTPTRPGRDGGMRGTWSLKPAGAADESARWRNPGYRAA
ncbi:hypothetical protein C8Q73DRAFT_707470 [Cubamyces lactineus]|nr:hypothetical protein C8Q73DRAFT_707470 [Cubamyces lactineus]